MTKRSMMLATALVLAVGLAACGDDGGNAATADTGQPPDAGASGDTAEAAPDAVGGDAAADPVGDASGSPGQDADAGPADPALSGPLPLFAGAGEARMRMPIGVATVGYSPGSGPKTPYAEFYPGTDHQHTDLTVRALVLRTEAATLVLARIDAIGIWQDIVRDAAAHLREQGRDDLAGGLIVAATHTHSSGGRAFDHFIGEIAVGPYLPELYARMVAAIVEATLAADAVVEPARFGWTTIETGMLHKDRRCENDDLDDVQDDTMGLVKVEAIDGDLLAVMVNYAMHGTVIGTKDFVLSSDASGAVESGIASNLSDPAVVLFFQSWAGDMAPSTPHEYMTDPDGHDVRPAYQDLTAIAAGAADIVVGALDGIEMVAEVELDVETVALPLDNAIINPDGSFDDYAFGGIYCMSSEENCGPEQRVYEPDDLTCVVVPEDLTVLWTQLSAARIGGLGLVTLPGEPATSVGTELRASALAATGLDDVFVLGYAQSYFAYLLHPDDWWLGGYEAAGSLMGPGFAVFLIEMATAIAARMLDPTSPLPFTPLDLPPFDALHYDDLPFEAALGEPEVTAQPVGSADIIMVSWVGGDSAVDFPVVALEADQGGGVWAPVTHASGAAVTSRGPEIELGFAPDPSYDDTLHTDARTFHGTAKLPSRFAVPPTWGQPQGSYRLAIEGTRPAPYVLTSAAFYIE